MGLAAAVGDVFVEAAEAVSIVNGVLGRSPPVPQPPILHHEPERGVGHARQALMRERRPGIKPSAGALCEICVFARRRRHWLAEQRRRRDAAAVTLPVPLVPEDDARDAADAPLTSPRRRQSQAAATDVL